MREILFRGKRLGNGQWIEGLLMAYTDKIAQIGTFTDYGNYVRCDSSLAVDPKTVGQYTGLLDKNGKRIFEGDIVRDNLNAGKLARIEFLQQACGFVLVYSMHDSNLGHRTRKSGYEHDDSLEVIGNVYEAGDLLNDGM